MEEKNYSAKKGVKAIFVEDKDTKIIVNSTNSDEISIKYYDRKREYYTVEETDVLKIKKVAVLKWYHYIFYSWRLPRSLQISLPKEYAGKLEIKTSNGPVLLKNISPKNLLLETSNGKIIAENIAVENDLKLKTSNGKICAENLKGKSFEIKTGNGKVLANNIEIEDYFKCRTSNGKIEAEEIKSKDMDLKTSNGKIILENIDVTSSLKIKTSNGSVKGTIVGKREDFSIESKTGNGKNNMPQNISHSMQKGGKKLNIETSNGRIFIFFTK